MCALGRDRGGGRCVESQSLRPARCCLLLVLASLASAQELEVVHGPARSPSQCLTYDPAVAQCLQLAYSGHLHPSQTPIAPRSKIANDLDFLVNPPVSLKLLSPGGSKSQRQTLGAAERLCTSNRSLSGLCSNARSFPGSPFVIVDVHKELPRVAESLASIKAVSAVTALGPYQMLNLFESRAIQDGRRVKNVSQLAMPIHDLGLNGTGEIIGIADTGLDISHCLFRDDSVDDPGPTHRKVFANVPAYEGHVSSSFQHGTAVSASAVGYCNSDFCSSKNAGEQNGIAPGAKVAFIDVGAERSEGNVTVPVPVDFVLRNIQPISLLFKRMLENFSAPVSSSSWGTLGIANSDDSNQLDEFIHSNEGSSALPAFAAGNSGNEDAKVSVTQQASAKNVLAVGATYGSNDNLLLSALRSALKEHTKPSGDLGLVPAYLRITDDNLAAEVPPAALQISDSDNSGNPISFSQSNTDGSYSSEASKKLTLSFLNLSESEGQIFSSGCKKSDFDILSEDDAERTIAVVDGSTNVVNREGCSLEKKISTAGEAGIAALLMTGFSNAPVPINQRSINTSDTGDDPPAVGFITLQRALQLAGLSAALDSSLQVRVQKRAVPDNVGLHELAIPSFTGKGPTIDGRLKPDLVAPGEKVTTANSSSGCDVIVATGTSNAVPFAAGAAAIVRQHLREEHGIAKPTASLVKAILVNGARSMRFFDVPSRADKGIQKPASFKKGMPFLLEGDDISIDQSPSDSSSAPAPEVSPNESPAPSPAAPPPNEPPAPPPAAPLPTEQPSIYNGLFDWLPVDESPSNHSGWGFISLASSLSTPQSKEGNNRDSSMPAVLHVEDSVTLNTEDATHASLEIDVHAGQPLSMTMAYSDAPGVARRIDQPLVNDLDMSVRAIGANASFERPLLPPDRVNNVERVQVPKPEEVSSNDSGPVRMQVNVSAFALPEGKPQDFSLAIKGNFTVHRSLELFPKAESTSSGGASENGKGGRNGGAIAGAIIGIVVGGVALAGGAYVVLQTELGQRIRETFFGTYSALVDR